VEPILTRPLPPLSEPTPTEEGYYLDIHLLTPTTPLLRFYTRLLLSLSLLHLLLSVKGDLLLQTLTTNLTNRNKTRKSSNRGNCNMLKNWRNGWLRVERMNRRVTALETVSKKYRVL
jgi:hypothetical protein